MAAWTRRGFLVAGAGLLAACGARNDRADAGRADDGAVLSARPGAGPGSPGPLAVPGIHRLGLEAERDALLLVPSNLVPGDPAPLVLSLHGAGGDADAGLAVLRVPAEERGLLVVAPASRGSTWDAVGGRYGVDVALVDRALAAVFSAVAVDADRVAVAGFSDGASYALGLGLANGGLFGEVLAFSPGFVPPGARRTGRPRVFVSHGDADDVLPIDRTSRRIVPALRRDGYDVTYREFSGPHSVPPEIAREAADRLV
jgi:phospholipase/carboxylesterase